MKELTPKEEAKELIYKFKSKIEDYEFENAIVEAKQCALLCVDKMQRLLINLDTNGTLIEFDFYKQVKEEIINFN
jgi:hypothetical protein